MAEVALPPARPNKGQGLTTTRRFIAANGANLSGLGPDGVTVGLESGWQLWHRATAGADVMESEAGVTVDVLYVYEGVNQHFVADGEAGTCITDGDCYVRIGATVTAGALLYPDADGGFYTATGANGMAFQGFTGAASAGPAAAIALESVTFAAGVTEHVLAQLLPGVRGMTAIVAGGG